MKNLIFFAVILAHLNTFSQQQCGFDYFDNRPVELTSNRWDTGEILKIPVVFHVIHRSFDTYGIATNIPDEQIYSAVNSFNQLMKDNVHGDPGIRICLAGITRSTRNATYDLFGVRVNSPTGISDTELKQPSYWDKTHQYNVYIVYATDGNNGLGGIQGYAMFPTPSFNDGTVILYNAIGTEGTLKSYTNQNKVFVHELGHAFMLYHTFQSTTNCANETNCLTQGDRICDTPPSTTSSACSSPIGCPNAPFNNHMHYSSQVCRQHFTPEQIVRMRNTIINSPYRNTLLTSYACVYEFSANCPNDICETAQLIGLCEPTYVENYTCNTEFLQSGMSSMVGNCANTLLNVPCPSEHTHYNSLWLEVNIPTAGEYQMTFNAIDTFSYTQAGTSSYGTQEGVMISLYMKGDNCQESTIVWGTFCFTAAHCNPGLIVATSGVLPYDPTRQNWDITLQFSVAGNYYVEIMGYGIPTNNPLCGEVPNCSSQGSGTFTICSTTPNPLPIELTSFKARPQQLYDYITWTTASETNNNYFNIDISIDGVNWTSVASVNGAGNSSTSIDYFLNNYKIKEGVYYYQLTQIDYNGTSVTYKPVFVVRNSSESPYKYYNILGQYSGSEISQLQYGQLYIRVDNNGQAEKYIRTNN